MRKTRFISIRSKFLLLFCLLITLPFLLSGILTYRKYSSNVERDAEAYSQQIAEQVAINLEQYLKDIDRVTLSLYYDNEVMEILHRRRGPMNGAHYLTVSERAAMNSLISSVVIDRMEIEGAFVFALDGSLFSNLQETIRSSWDIGNLEWMARTKTKDGGLAILPPSEGDYYLDEPRNVLSLTRLIKNPQTTEDLGYVKIDLSSQGFEKIISKIRVTPNSRLFVYNEDGQQLYPFETNAEPLDAAIADEDAKQSIVSEHLAEYGRLRVVSVVPRDDVLKDARQLTSYTLWITVSSLVLAYVAAVLAANIFVKPINHLLKKMRRVQNGDFHERAAVYSRDEVGLLTEGFNYMVSRLDHMIKDMYELRLREKDAELSALQSQMNPHFLYNTLESISMVAHQERSPELSNVITSLGKLLRYTINNKERFMTLREELEFMEYYLNIQSFRLEDRLSWEIMSDFSHEQAIVPKLILQPLAENAIEHGLGDQGTLKITIVTKTIGEDLFIFVMDTGAGISPERRIELERLLSGEPRSDKKTKGFALLNIHQRIRMLYGEPYGLTIEHTSTPGASIYIRLPFNWEES